FFRRQQIDVRNCSCFFVLFGLFGSFWPTRVVVLSDYGWSFWPTTLFSFDYLFTLFCRYARFRSLKIVLIGAMASILLKPPLGRDVFEGSQFFDTLYNGTSMDAGHTGNGGV